MKAAAFDYLVALDADDAVRLLGEHGDDALLLAGGQSLVPMMAMRLARPSVLIDINGCADLTGIGAAAEGLRIRAGSRQKDVLKSAEVGQAVPLLAKALPFVGHIQTRNRGTVGGSLAHGDPSAEMPLVAVTLNAEITLRSAAGQRKIAASEFYTGPMSSIREANECLTEVVFPIWSGPMGCGFHEVSERHGDFAIVSVAAQMQLNGDGICTQAAIGIGGAHSHPIKAANAEAALIGKPISEDVIAEAASLSADGIEAMDDVHASAAYRLRVVRVLAARAISDAAAEAGK
ncbi:MAG: FAD binding domain-containing protein [Rhodospirillales bacterium]|nr:FAD binding domain-containing protein [Rhodospirillales bacterium]